MKTTKSLSAFAAAFLALSGAQAAEIDGSAPAICALGEIIECAPTQDCMRVSAQSVGAPRFLRIDFESSEITRVHAGEEDVTSPIERQEEVDGKLVLQGAEDGVEGEPDGLGWSLSIDQASGEMVLTGSGDQVAFVIFGACTTP